MYGRGLYTGSGGFLGDLWKNTLGSKKFRTRALDSAAAVGNVLAPQYGSQIGMARQLARATGLGGYTVGGKRRANALIDGGAGRALGVPAFAPESDTGAVTVSYRMYVRDVFAPGSQDQVNAATRASTFSTQVLDINPGLEASFPWLSQLASNYEQYQMHQLIYTFVSTVSNFETTTGVTGDVLMLHQQNSQDRLPTEAWQMKNTHGVVSGQVTDDLLCGIECDPAKTPGDDIKFVRYQGLDSDVDPEKYDKGRLVVATANCPPQLLGQKIGEIWCSYTVTLAVPKVVSATGATIRQDLFINDRDLAVFPMSSRTDPNLSVHLLSSPESVKLFSHVHNSIGVKVERLDPIRATEYPYTISNTTGTVPNCFFISQDNYDRGTNQKSLTQLTFPAGVTGDFEIEVLVQSNNRLDSQATVADGAAFLGEISWGGVGQVAGIYDICCGSIEDDTNFLGTGDAYLISGGQQPCISGIRFFDGGTGPTDQADHMYGCFWAKLHVRVKGNQDGLDNKVILCAQLCSDYTVVSNGSLESTTIRVSEYNSLSDVDQQKQFENESGQKLLMARSKPSPVAPFVE
jgi:hypothetical protein